MNIGHEAPLRVGKLIAVFCSCPCAIRSGVISTAAIETDKRIRFNISSSFARVALELNLEQLFGVVFEDHFLFGGAEKIERFDQVTRLVEPLPCFGILHRSDSRPLGSE